MEYLHLEIPTPKDMSEVNQIISTLYFDLQRFVNWDKNLPERQNKFNMRLGEIKHENSA